MPRKSRFHRVHLDVIAWPRFAKRWLMLLVDGVALPLLVVLAFMLRLDRPPHIPEDSWLLPAASLVTLTVLYLLRFYRMVIRFLGSEMAYAIVAGMTLSSVALAALAYMVPAAATPRSVFVIYWLLGLLYFGGSRFVARRYLLWASGQHGRRRPVVIFGAGGAGIQAAASLINAGEYQPVAFVDDDTARRGELLQGLPVLDRRGLQDLLERRRIHTVLLAMPSASRSRRMEIVRFLEPFGVKVKTVPALADIIQGKARIEELRDVAIEELLGRDPIPPRQELLDVAVKGKHVLVTGAGGSIGSELCRQLLKLNPTRLVLLEVSEIALYSMEQELRAQCGRCSVQLVAVLGSVTDRALVSSVMTRYRIQTVYHAAAYKHVPIVEHNVCSGVRNNVVGTQVMAEEAEKAGVERFILVSTDKAVRPTNVMGASKRLAELVLQAMADRGSSTIFTMVRFGNVLGSSGSVVPLFREQIRLGGPVTVTHPDVIRYFMTIPEASQLVIQAGAMARGGEVFVLDMGDPVRIYDLACTMIRLMGMSLKDADHPEGDIEIRFTGLRAGEKLYEELLIGDDSSGTDHPAIMRANEEMIPWSELASSLVNLMDLLQRRDDIEIRGLLRRCVKGYRPAEDHAAATKTGSRPALQPLH
jgi:FlaA1/EpsC-like NDP-sugar epimerase